MHFKVPRAPISTAEDRKMLHVKHAILKPLSLFSVAGWLSAPVLGDKFNNNESEIYR